jgi:hypothetical protein
MRSQTFGRADSEGLVSQLNCWVINVPPAAAPLTPPAVVGIIEQFFTFGWARQEVWKWLKLLAVLTSYATAALPFFHFAFW